MNKPLRKIIHIDMDCFFAAIEMLDYPEYRDIPLAVGGQAESRSVLCTANYEARKYGVHSALSSAIAVRRCPKLIIVKPRPYRYKEVSKKIQLIFSQYTKKVQMLSLDEGFLDVTNYCDTHQIYATRLAKEIRHKIFAQTGLSASAGISHNKFLAKISSDWNKPNGQWVVTPQQAKKFSYQLELRKVPGIGAKGIERCHDLGIYKLGDIRDKGMLWTIDHFGKNGHKLYLKSLGEDHSEVTTSSQRKSISCEHTFPHDLHNQQEVNDHLPLIFSNLEQRIKNYFKPPLNKPNPLEFLPIKKLFIKMKTKDFKVHTHELIYSETMHWDLNLFTKLTKALYTNIDSPSIRLLGIGVKLHYTRNDELEKLGQLRLI